jgi:dihydrodipicolinate synthase/N-acetylneuraminate lyase
MDSARSAAAGVGPLTRAGLGGIWAGLPTPFDARDRLDTEAFAESVATAAGWGVAGVYTTGSTGEWFALDDGEFGELMAALEEGRCAAAAAGHAVPAQAGVTATATRLVLRRAELALEQGADALQVALPPWIPLSDEEVVGFFREIAAAFPGVPIVHYNVQRAGRLLDGPAYRRVADAVPELVGAKITGSDDVLWASLRAHVPDLALLVGETLLPLRVPDGARGTCSSYIYYAPALMTRLWEAVRDGRTKDARDAAARFEAFEAEVIDPLAAEGHEDAAIDKAFAAASGHLPVEPRIRAPYRGVPADVVEVLAVIIRERYPDFLEVPR